MLPKSRYLIDVHGRGVDSQIFGNRIGGQVENVKYGI